MRYMKQLVFVMLVLVLVSALLFSACAKPATVPTTPTAPTTPTTPTPAPAPEVIELTYASPYSPPVNVYAVLMEAWIERIQEQTNGRVHITPYWGGSLIAAREALAELTKGVADIGLATAYTESGYEILKAFSCFVWNSPSNEVSMRVGREIYEEFPEFQQEFPGLLCLGYSQPAPDTLQSIKQIKKMEDLKGLTISCDTPGDLALSHFGAETVMQPPPENYVSIQKGLLDGVFLPTDTLESFKFAEVIKYVNLDVSCPNASIPIQWINMNTYNSLPPDIQKVFIDNIDWYVEEGVNYFNETVEKGAQFGKDQGDQFVNLSPAELLRWQDTLAGIGADKAKQVDAAGKPGTKILEETQRLIKQYSK